MEAKDLVDGLETDKLGLLVPVFDVHETPLKEPGAFPLSLEQVLSDLKERPALVDALAIVPTPRGTKGAHNVILVVRASNHEEQQAARMMGVETGFDIDSKCYAGANFYRPGDPTRPHQRQVLQVLQDQPEKIIWLPGADK